MAVVPFTCNFEITTAQGVVGSRLGHCIALILKVLRAAAPGFNSNRQLCKGFSGVDVSIFRFFYIHYITM